MSDFDKEAEREKLREKYEKDQEEREVAEKMSELLLQGATMTNAHCSECGDPIFRYDGQEFCATCEKAVDRGTDEDEEVDEDNIEVTTPDENARVQFGGGEEADAEADPPERADQAEQPQQPDRPQRSGQPRQADQAAERSQPNEQPPSPETQPDDATAQQQPPAHQPRNTAESQQQRRQPGQPAQSRTVPSVDPGGEADVSTARESLVRTLTRFSQQAEATEDPQRASEYLAAAREAAETLSALRLGQ
jgi:uncharacterized Zn finger protein (UPF0148 family)